MFTPENVGLSISNPKYYRAAEVGEVITQKAKNMPEIQSTVKNVFTLTFVFLITSHHLLQLSSPKGHSTEPHWMRSDAI